VETETTIVGNAVVNGSDSTAAPAAPAATPPGPAEMQAEPEQNIPSLLNAYRAATDTMDRERFAFDIEAIGTPEAGAAFASLASTESDEELKSLLLTLLADSEATVETKIAAFAEALRPGQSEMVREAAADSLQGVEDPRTIAVWRQFLSDPLVGDIAKDAIEFLESRKE
jgi:HEAT repeat protein